MATKYWCVTTVLCAVLLATPATLSAQGDVGAIEGLVADATGAVLPGVTVTATSSALIEGSRTAVSDSDGHYRILRLPVGEYSLRFELQGFNSAVREHVIVNASFTATINAELKVGAVAETITVRGASPVVDVKTTTTQTVITTEVVQALPTSRTVFDISKYLIGTSTTKPDVGGTSFISGGGTPIQIHGSNANDRAYFRDGTRAVAYFGGGDAPRVTGNQTAQQEVTYQTSALPAAVANGGILINMVFKDGGNRVSGSLFGNYGNEHMQSSNLDSDLQARGVITTSSIKQVWDFDSGLGGPIKKDKAWFYASYRHYATSAYLANSFEPDGSKSYDFQRNNDEFYKVTWQVNATNKISVSFDHDAWWHPFRRDGGAPSGTALFFTPEATFNDADINYPSPYNRNVNTRWTNTIGNKWIFEAGVGYMRVGAGWFYQPSVKPTDVARLDLVTQTLYGAAWRIRGDVTNRNDFTASATRLFSLMGFHELKVGTQNDWGSYREPRNNNGDLILNFRNGVPDSVDLFNTPLDTLTNIENLGFYAQDSWTAAKRLTINAGIRYDRLRTTIAARSIPAGTWVPARNFPEIPNVPLWNNVVPRLGVSYDLLGDGRTVLKGSFSKYVGNEAIGVAAAVNPMAFSTNHCAWTDTNGDGNAQVSEMSRCTGFGGAVSTTVDPNIERHFNREYTAGLQRELASNLGLSVMYYRRENRNLRALENLAAPPSAYTPVTITNPLTNAPLTIYNIQPAFLGLQQNLLTNTNLLDYTYNGVELTVQRRFSASSFILAGYHYGKSLGTIIASSGATTRDVFNPNNLIYSDGAVGNDEPHQFKVSGSTLLPGGMSLSGSYLAYTGHTKQRTFVVSRTLVPTLTAASVTVPLEPNNANRYPNIQITDLRVSRSIKLGRVRAQPALDILNLFNTNKVLTQVVAVGPSLDRVSSTIGPRIIKFGANIDF